MVRRPVDCSCFYASWLFKQSEDAEDNSGLKFFEKLSECDDMTFFKNRTIQRIIKYRWETSYKYMITYIYIPFMVLFYLPYMTFAIMSCEISDDEFWGKTSWGLETFKQFLLLLMALEVFGKIYTEGKELITIGSVKYFSDGENLLDFS